MPWARSSDGTYNGLSSDAAGYNLTAKILDSGSGSILLNESSGATVVSEQGVTDTYTLALSKAPTASVTINVLPTAQVATSPTSVTFTTANWNTPQTVTVSAVNDATAEGDALTNITHTVVTNDRLYSGMNIPALAVNVIDNDKVPITISHLDGFTAVAEGGVAYPGTVVTGMIYASDIFRISLPKAPTANVTVTLIPDAQFTVSPTSLTFTSGNYSTTQNVTITAVDDTVAEATPHQGVLRFAIASTDPYYNGSPTPPMLVPVRDNDAPGFSLVETGLNTTITAATGGVTTPSEGGTDTYTVVLTKAPTNPVYVLPVSTDTTTGVTVSPALLTFTSATWNTPQTVTATAIADNVAEGRKVANVTNSIRPDSDSAFTDLPAQTMPVWVTDVPRTNESVILVATGNSYYVAEGGKTDTIGVYLSNKPKTDVTFTIDGNSQLSCSVNSLLFTPTNWNVPQTVTVTALDDTAISSTSYVEGNHSSSLQFRCNAPLGVVLPGDPAFTFVNPTQSFNIVDNDAPGVIFEETGTSTDTVEGGATDTYTAKLSKAPNGNVVVAATSANLTLGQTVSPASVTFNASNWNVPQTFTVTAFNDTSVEGNHNYNITHAITVASTTDTTGYAALTGLQTITNYITDNDNRVIVTQSGLETRVGENGSLSDNYQIVLRSAPTQSVTVNITVPTNQGFTTSVSSVLFTTANWSTPQTVTVTGVNNSVNDRIHTSNITHASVSTDTNFNAQTISVVPVIVYTIDRPQAILVENGNTTVLSEAGVTDTYFMALSQAPTSDVTVTIQPDSQVAINGPTTLTFTPSNWSMYQTVTVRAVDDLAVESSTQYAHLGMITHSISSSDTAFNNIAIGSVPCFITDNDAAHVDVLHTGGSTTVAEGGITDTYQVVLNSAPTANVVVTGTANTQLSLSPATRTFTTANWATPQSFTVTAVNDATIEGNHTGTVTHSVTSTDSNYNQSSVSTLIANITDNDGAQLMIGESGGSTAVIEGGAADTITIRLSEAPASGNVDVTLVAPTYVIPTPPYARSLGYYTSDLGGSNQNRDRIVLDYTEVNLLYRSTFYGSLATAYGGSGNIPNTPGETQLQNAHWAATKAMIDKMDLWWSGGSLKARYPVLVEPNQTLPNPLPAPNPRQVILEAIYQINGGNNSLGTTRYLPEVVFDPKNPPVATFHDEIRDRCRWAGYLMTTVAPGLISH